MNTQVYNNLALPPTLQNASDTAWKSQIEHRLSGFDSKIDNLVEMLKVNQQFVMNNQMQFYNNNNSSSSSSNSNIVFLKDRRIIPRDI